MQFMAADTNSLVVSLLIINYRHTDTIQRWTHLVLTRHIMSPSQLQQLPAQHGTINKSYL